MSWGDRIAARLLPLATPQRMAQATDRARALADPGDWLSLALLHHDLRA